MKLRDLILLVRDCNLCAYDTTDSELGVITENEIKLDQKHLDREILSISPYSDMIIDIIVK